MPLPRVVDDSESALTPRPVSQLPLTGTGAPLSGLVLPASALAEQFSYTMMLAGGGSFASVSPDPWVQVKVVVIALLHVSVPTF